LVGVLLYELNSIDPILTKGGGRAVKVGSRRVRASYIMGWVEVEGWWSQTNSLSVQTGVQIPSHAKIKNRGDRTEGKVPFSSSQVRKAFF
jgi:hypothetical protein